MKLFYSLKAVRPQWGTLMYTLFELIYGLLNISLKSLALLTATFFEWNLKEDSPGYTLQVSKNLKIGTCPASQKLFAYMRKN